jgi:type IV secretory pathway TraG/TraD family ATPase VirD4
MARYHDLGYTPLSDAQLRDTVFAGEQLVVLLSFGASARKLADCEKFIGWAEAQHLRNLQLVVNNARFLILLWIQSKRLASKILVLAARQLPHDWLQRYAYSPVLLENIANILVDPEGSLDKRNHWEKTSHALLVGAILHGLYAEPDKTLAGVAAAAQELLNKFPNERSGVRSTAMPFLGLYRDPVVAEVTRRCDWRIADLVSDARPATLYVVVPPSDIARAKPLIRLMLNQIGRRLTEDLKAGGARHRLLFMLDEFPVLGRLDFFESALAYMAGYGIKSFLIAQSLNQIEKA